MKDSLWSVFLTLFVEVYRSNGSRDVHTDSLSSSQVCSPDEIPADSLAIDCEPHGAPVLLGLSPQARLHSSRTYPKLYIAYNHNVHDHTSL